MTQYNCKPSNRITRPFMSLDLRLRTLKSGVEFQIRVRRRFEVIANFVKRSRKPEHVGQTKIQRRPEHSAYAYTPSRQCEKLNYSGHGL